jgi:hypothetical protein
MRGTWREGSFTGDPERYVKALEWASVYIVASLLLNMEGRSFLRAFEINRYILRYLKMPYRWVSLSIGAPLGNLEALVYRDRKSSNPLQINRSINVLE